MRPALQGQSAAGRADPSATPKSVSRATMHATP
jgi:hypothetical protein